MRHFLTVSLGRGTKAFEVVSARGRRHAASLLAARWRGVKAVGSSIEVFYTVFVQEVHPPEPGDTIIAAPGVWPSIGPVDRYRVTNGRAHFEGTVAEVDLERPPPTPQPITEDPNFDSGSPVG